MSLHSSNVEFRDGKYVINRAVLDVATVSISIVHVCKALLFSIFIWGNCSPSDRFDELLQAYIRQVTEKWLVNYCHARAFQVSLTNYCKA